MNQMICSNTVQTENLETVSLPATGYYFNAVNQYPDSIVGWLTGTAADRSVAMAGIEALWNSEFGKTEYIREAMLAILVEGQALPVGMESQILELTNYAEHTSFINACKLISCLGTVRSQESLIESLTELQSQINQDKDSQNPGYIFLKKPKLEATILLIACNLIESANAGQLTDSLSKLAPELARPYHIALASDFLKVNLSSVFKILSKEQFKANCEDLIGSVQRKDALWLRSWELLASISPEGLNEAIGDDGQKILKERYEDNFGEESRLSKDARDLKHHISKFIADLVS